jgi:hypothetical protein
MDNRKVPEKVTSKAQVSELVDKNICKKSWLLGSMSGILPENSFKMRRRLF